MDYENSKGRKHDKTPVDGTMQISYTEPGTSDSPLEAGGFVVDYPPYQTEALAADYFSDRNYLAYNWAV